MVVRKSGSHIVCKVGSLHDGECVFNMHIGDTERVHGLRLTSRLGTIIHNLLAHFCLIKLNVSYEDTT